MMQNIDNRKYLSETIGVLRFPLMVCVVLIHIDIPNLVNHLFVDIFDSYIIESFVRIAVPLFFFISGFLFFKKVENFGWVEYKNKIKNRVKRLLVPYLLWNIIVIVLKYIFYKIGLEKADYLFEDGLRWVYHIIWRPINIQLWFVRDLFLVVLMSPIVYFLIKRLKVFFVMLLCGAWLLWHKSIFTLVGIEYYMWGENIFGIFGLDFVSLFFFSFGAWFALEKRDFTLVFQKLFLLAIGLYTVCTIAKFVIVDEYCADIFNRLAIVSGLMSAVVIVYELVRRGKMKRNMFLENGSQFIYYYHMLFMMYYTSMLNRFHLFDMGSGFVYFLIYILTPVIIILLGLGLYKVGMKWMPGVMKVILGLK